MAMLATAVFAAVMFVLALQAVRRGGPESR
jgi:hypothetical protein